MIARLRLAARLARREMWRRKMRTLLVLMLVAVPVGATSIAVVLLRTEPTNRDQYISYYGQSDYAISGDVPAGVVPQSAHTATLRQAITIESVGDERAVQVTLAQGPYSDPLTKGILRVERGRAPGATGEVMLDASLARRWHVNLGDTLTLQRPAKTPVHVVGIGQFVANDSLPSVVLGPETMHFPDGRGQTTRLVASPALGIPLDAAQAAVQGNISVRADWRATSDSGFIGWTRVWEAVALAVFGIVIAAAFAAGVRRQTTTQGLLAANGAPASTRRAALYIQGTVLGFAGGVLGAAAGVLGTLSIAPRFSALDQHTFSLDRVNVVSDIVPLVVLGAVAATIAAIFPARSASRMPALRAIAGGGPAGKLGRTSIVAGAVSVASGLAIVAYAAHGHRNSPTRDTVIYLMTAGALAILLGACALTPAYVHLAARVTRRAKGSTRLAVRSLVRNRGRSAAAIASVAAACALAIAASTALVADRSYGGPSPASRYATIGSLTGFDAPSSAAVAQVRQALPKAKEVRISQATLALDAGATDGGFVSYGYYGNAFVVATPETLALYDLDDAARRALASVGAIALAPDRSSFSSYGFYGDISGVSRIEDVPATTESFAGQSGAVDVLVKGVSVENYDRLQPLPTGLIRPDVAAAKHLRLDDNLIVFDNHHPLGHREITALNALLPDNGGVTDELADAAPATLQTFQLNFDEGNGGLTRDQIAALLAALASVAAIVVVGFVVGLSASEAREERNLLSIAGAGTGTLRGTSARRTLAIVFLGAVLAVPIGFVPVAEIVKLRDYGPLRFPWMVVGVLVIALPVVAALLTSLGSALVLAARPIRISSQRDE